MTYTHDDARRDAPTITGDNKCGEGSTMWLKADGEIFEVEMEPCVRDALATLRLGRRFARGERGLPLKASDILGQDHALEAVEAYITHLTTENERLRDALVAADALAELVEFTDDGEACWFDHHGYCQAHGCGDWGDYETTPHCPTDAERLALAAYRTTREAVGK
jgi:hypothetical protein